MEQYNYEKAVMDDVKEYINDEYSEELENIETVKDLEEFADTLQYELWTNDCVTGNGSGSYTFNRLQAKEYVTSDIDELRACVETFDNAKEMFEYFLNDDWELLDVCIRCYVLDRVIYKWAEEFSKEKGLK